MIWSCSGFSLCHSASFSAHYDHWHVASVLDLETPKQALPSLFRIPFYADTFCVPKKTKYDIAKQYDNIIHI